MKLPALNKLVCVQWLDAYSSTGWTDENTKPDPRECFSAGWLVAKTNQAIQLSQSISDTPGCRRAGLISIPVGCVIAVQVLK